MFSFFILGHGWHFMSSCVMTRLFCKLGVKIQSSFILFTYMGESDGQNTRGKLLF